MRSNYPYDVHVVSKLRARLAVSFRNSAQGSLGKVVTQDAQHYEKTLNLNWECQWVGCQKSQAKRGENVFLTL